MYYSLKTCWSSTFHFWLVPSFKWSLKNPQSFSLLFFILIWWFVSFFKGRLLMHLFLWVGWIWAHLIFSSFPWCGKHLHYRFSQLPCWFFSLFVYIIWLLFILLFASNFSSLDVPLLSSASPIADVTAILLRNLLYRGRTTKKCSWSLVVLSDVPQTQKF